MCATQVNLTICDDQTPRLYVSPGLAAQLQIDPSKQQPETLHFGLRSLAITVLPTADLRPSAAELARTGAKALLVPQKLKLSMYRTGRGHLRLGPLLGILISDDKLASMRAGSQDSVYRRYSHYAQEIDARAVFITPSGINADDDSATGHLITARGLVAVKTPLPRIFYDRCFGPTGRDDAYAFRRLARAKGITVVNHPVKMTKLATYRTIRSDPGLRAVLPYFSPLSLTALEKAMERFPSVYLKPDDLSKGQGVCRVQRRGQNWVLQQSDEHGVHQQVFTSAQSVLQHLPLQHEYLLQEGIDLATYLGNRYDFRALVQKDGAGVWQLTGLVARIAPRRGVITSPRSGGLVAPALRALQHSFGPERGHEVMHELTAACLRIARHMEEAYGLCAELGLDVGVTRAGQVRLIEVNSRPLKVSLTRLRDPEIDARIFRYPIYFAALIDMQEAGPGQEPSGRAPSAMGPGPSAEGQAPEVTNQ